MSDTKPNISPAKAHFLRITAAQEAAAASADNPLANASGHELMLAKLAQDRQRLKSIQSLEKKLDLKRQILPEYRPYIEGVLAGGNGAQDAVFMAILVWLIDVGYLAEVVPLVNYAITHNLVPADNYQRTTACLIAEEVADTALKLIADEEPVDLIALSAISGILAGQDMPDEVRAKLYKAIGYTLREAAEHPSLSAAEATTARQQAIDNLQSALKLHDKVGVKKDIADLERTIKHATDAPPP